MVAALATGGLVFTVDPRDIQLAGHLVAISNIAAYSIGFFAFWLVAAASSFTTRLLLRDGDDHKATSQAVPADQRRHLSRSTNSAHGKLTLVRSATP